MGRPKADAHLISTPQRILFAAEEAFANDGFDARLGDIAASAGIRRPSLLYHFESKEVLYAAVIARTFGNLGDALRQSRAVEGGFESQLEAMTRAFVRFVEDHPTVARLVVREILAQDGPGSVILIGQVAPLLDEVERWIQASGGERVRSDVSVRGALMQVVSDVLLRCCSASAVRQVLWGPPDETRTWLLARVLILTDGGAS